LVVPAEEPGPIRRSRSMGHGVWVPARRDDLWMGLSFDNSLAGYQAASVASSSITASPICDVLTILAPSDLMSAVRSPLAKVAAIA
jgi:hypothetical protein